MQYQHAKMNMREFETEMNNLKTKYKSKFFFISLKEDKVIVVTSCFMTVTRCEV